MKRNWLLFGRARPGKTVGPYLSVDLPQLDINDLTAKVDTGAFSGALHASGIKEIKNQDGKKVLQFKPHGSQREIIQVDTYHKRRVKSSNGQADARYAFDTDITILGDTYMMTVTLTNRSNMKYPMLIGRKFLQTHGFLVDVSISNQ